MPYSDASIFADPEDLRRYQEAIASGATEEQALKVGDNGKGAWGDNTASTTDPIVALPPDMPGVYHNRLVQITGPKGTVVARVGDKAPNNGRIDLNPAAAMAVGHPGGVVPVQWSFLGGSAPDSPNVDLRDSAPVSLSIPEIAPQPGVNLDSSPANMPSLLSADINDPSSGVFSTDTYAPENAPESPATPEATPETTDISHPSAKGATITARNPDGSVSLSNGTKLYKDGHIEFDVAGATAVKFGPNSKAIIRNKPTEKPPIMVGGLPYKMNENGELAPITVQGESAATLADPYEGLNDVEKAKVTALIEGRLPVTSRQLASKDPQFKKILDRVVLADPTFTASNYDVRRRAALDFSPGGKVGQNIVSLNQTINHLGHLEEVSKQIGSVPGMPFLNAPIQAAQRFLGVNPALRSYGLTSEALEQELTKLLKGGVATAGEVDQWRSQLAPSQSPAYREQAFKDVIAILGGRLDAIQGGYKDVFGKNKEDLITGGARNVLQRHGWDFATTDQTPEATPAPTPQPEEAKVAGVPMSQAKAAYLQAVEVLKPGSGATPEQIKHAQQAISDIENHGGIPSQ